MPIAEHEKLEVYSFALQFVVVANDIARALPPGRRYVADQLDRAALSIVLNTAEGAGEFRKRDKARFYGMAARSATECAAILDVCTALSLSNSEQIASAKPTVVRIAAMLSSLDRGCRQQGR